MLKARESVVSGARDRILRGTEGSVVVVKDSKEVIKSIIAMVNKYPNDMLLGEKIREFIRRIFNR